MRKKLVLVFSADFSAMCVMSITSMTHVPEIGAENWYQKTGTGFCSIWHAIWYRIFLVLFWVTSKTVYGTSPSVWRQLEQLWWNLLDGKHWSVKLSGDWSRRCDGGRIEKLSNNNTLKESAENWSDGNESVIRFLVRWGNLGNRADDGMLPLVRDYWRLYIWTYWTGAWLAYRKRGLLCGGTTLAAGPCK